jgi:hypothetical protein
MPYIAPLDVGDNDGARPTIALCTALLGPRQPLAATQILQQRHGRIDAAKLLHLAVEDKGEVIAHCRGRFFSQHAAILAHKACATQPKSFLLIQPKPALLCS